MNHYIITYKFDTSTTEGENTYKNRYDAFFNILGKEDINYIKDDTTSTVIYKSNEILFNSNGGGIVNKIFNKKFLLNKDEILFCKFKDKKFEIAGRIKNLSYYQDQKIIDFFK